MDTVQAIVGSPLTIGGLLLGEIALIITAFVRGWIVSSAQVANILLVQNLRIAEAIQRGDDWHNAYLAEQAKNAVLAEQLNTLAVVGETVSKILSALPAPEAKSTSQQEISP